jgi:hypothetical protein
VNDQAADYRPSETENGGREHHFVAAYCHSRNAETTVHDGPKRDGAIARDAAELIASKDLPDNGESAYEQAGGARRGFPGEVDIRKMSPGVYFVLRRVAGA